MDKDLALACPGHCFCFSYYYYLNYWLLRKEQNGVPPLLNPPHPHPPPLVTWSHVFQISLKLEEHLQSLILPSHPK